MSETMISEMIRQSFDVGNPEVFKCKSCRNYKGSLSCEQRIFIAFEGANMEVCSFYQWGIKCNHCGRVT